MTLTLKIGYRTRVELGRQVKESIAVIHGRDDGDLDQGGNERIGEK